MLANIERHLDILLCRQGRYQVERLEDHADLVVAHRGQLPFRHARNIHAINQYLPGRGIIQSGDDAEQGTLCPNQMGRQSRQIRRS